MRKMTGSANHNPKNRLTKKQKQKLVSDIKILKSDIASLETTLNRSKRQFDKINQDLEHAQADLRKIEYSINKKWFEACAEICRSNNWYASTTFDEAAEMYRNWTSRRLEAEGLCAKAIVQIEKQLRDELKIKKKLSIEIQATDRKLLAKQNQLNKLQKL